MRLLGDVISWRSLDGEPVTIGDTTVTPRSQALIVRLPFGAYVWHRPASVQIERDGQIQRVPIIEVTRVVGVALFACGFLVAVISNNGRASR
jgi:hypothetical protein